MGGNRRSPAFWVHLIRQIRLAWHLFWDRRVPLLPKIIPLVTLLYIVSPIDIIPDVILGLGQLDDLSLFLFSIYAFVALCPRDLVERVVHDADSDVIDGEAYTRPDDRTPSPKLPKTGK